MMTSVRLTTVNDKKIHFGDSIQLKCDGTVNKDSILTAKAVRSDCFINVSGDSCSGSPSSAINSNSAFILRR
jgi:hypothetical protein